MEKHSPFDEIIERRGTHSYKWDHAGGNDVTPMWVADMDFRTAPCIIDALRRRVEHGIFGYVAVPDEYYRSITNWFGKRHAWNIDRDWIIYTTGVVPAISAIIQGLTPHAHDEVIVLTPVYNCFFSSIRNSGCQVSESPLIYRDNSYFIDFDDLERRAARPEAFMLLMCNPHNPAGRVWTRDELIKVGEICRRHNVIIVSDEIHCELVMPGQHFTPMASISPLMQDMVITCNSPSKSFNIAGLQIANIVTSNAAWREQINRAININEICDVNPLGVEALMAAYTHQGAAWLDELNDYIWGNYCALKKLFATQLPHLPVTILEGTYLAWVNITSLHKSSDEVTQALLSQARVAVNSGTMYGAAGQGFIRLNLAMPREPMMQALERMVPVLK